MPQPMTPPPFSAQDPVTDVLHGVPITDPYRWLEDRDSPRTRSWIESQTLYARAYFDNIPERNAIRKRLQELVDVETYDSLMKSGDRYFFRKRLVGEEQPSIYMREGANGKDQLLVSPRDRGTGQYTAVKPLQISPDGRLLLYEVKVGGERTGTFELLEIDTRTRLIDFLPRGYLRGFAFGPDGESFYYSHEAVDSAQLHYRAAYRHFLGTPRREDQEILYAGEDSRIRLGLVSGSDRLAFIVHRFFETTLTDIYLMPLAGTRKPVAIFLEITYSLGLHLLPGRIVALTDRDAPNRRIVELRLGDAGEHRWVDIVPEADAPIDAWLVAGDYILVSYSKNMKQQVRIFDLFGVEIRQLPLHQDETNRILQISNETSEILLEAETFTEPLATFRYSPETNEKTLWARRDIPFASTDYTHCQVWFLSKDRMKVPMYLVGRRDVLARHDNPTIMTSYGGFGASMTPQFSLFVAFLLEQGCLFALPNIRGGLEFGVSWHNAAKRRGRQTAYDDFLSAAEWLFDTGWTARDRLAIFGGSNSGLLVGAALTQRPDLFRAVVCMVPLLDMLRYHLFDGAYIWKDEFGTAEDSNDFAALVKYSPYHNICDGRAYPATLIISGDADHTCNSLHARKMTARLQAANTSHYPILVDYNKFRGHSPVLPVTDRIDALTDRIAFLCEQLNLPCKGESHEPCGFLSSKPTAN